ncbi:RNA-directed DNA polymerase, eukaryota, partial [Tanacetum coccineum]
ANYLGELVQELPLHYPSWRQVPVEQKARVMARIGFDMRPHMESDRWPLIYAAIQQHLQKIYNGKKAALKERNWILDSDGTYDLERIRLSRPSYIFEVNWDAQIMFWNDPKNRARATQNKQNRAKSKVVCRQGSRSIAALRDMHMESSATREYPSLIHTFFLTHTVNGVFLNPEDKALYEEMLRLQGLGSNTETGVPYTEDEIMAIVRGGKQRGHIPGVGRVLPGQGTVIPPPPPCTHSSDVVKLKKREKVLTRQVNMFMKLFRSDDKFSQMLTQLESQPEIGGGSGSGGRGDDEQGDDEDDGEDGEDEDDNMGLLDYIRTADPRKVQAVEVQKGEEQVKLIDSIKHCFVSLDAPAVVQQEGCSGSGASPDVFAPSAEENVVAEESVIPAGTYLDLMDPKGDLTVAKKGDAARKQPDKVKRKKLSKQSDTLPAKKLRVDHPSLASGTGGKSLASLRRTIPEGSLALGPSSQADVHAKVTVQGSHVADAPVYTAADTVTSSRGKTHSASMSNMGGSYQLETSEGSADSFYETAALNSEDAKRWYIPRWNITNDSLFDDGFSYRTLICLGSEVRSRTEHKLELKKKLWVKYDAQGVLLKEKDVKIARLKSLVKEKETESAEVSRLRDQVFVLTAEKSSLNVEVSVSTLHSAFRDFKEKIEAQQEAQAQVEPWIMVCKRVWRPDMSMESPEPHFPRSWPTIRRLLRPIIFDADGPLETPEAAHLQPCLEQLSVPIYHVDIKTVVGETFLSFALLNVHTRAEGARKHAAALR